MPELKLSASRGGAPGGVVMLNGAVDTGYVVLPDIDWGSYAPEPVISSRQDGVGVVTSTTQEPRVIKMPISIAAASKAAAIALIQALGNEVSACHRSGGVLRWKSNQATYAVNLVVQAAKLESTQSVHWESHNRSDAMLTLWCDPAAYGDQMGFVEDFGPRNDGTSSLSDFTLDAGAGTLTLGVDTVVQARGALVPSSTANKRVRHTARGYNYTDAAVTMAWRTGASVASADFAVGIMDAAGNGLVARIQGSATNLLSVASVAAGTPTIIGAGTAFTPAANTVYWLRFIRSGPLVTAQVFTAAPFLSSTPAATFTTSLTAAQQQAAPAAQPAFRVTPTGTDERYMGLDVRPYTYLYAQPDTIRLTGIPGDLPALGDFEISVDSSLTTQAVWGMAAWDDRSPGANLVWNGGGQDNPAVTGTAGWSTAIVTNIVPVAATSIARTTAASRYSGSCLEFVSTAVANSGVGFTLNRRFKRGRSYVAFGWLQSAAGTGTAQIVLGNTTEGSPATSTAVALTAAFVLHSCVWTPTLDRDVATIGVRHVAATIETTRLDGMQVYDATPVTLSANIASTSATTCTVTAAPAEGWDFYRARVGVGGVVALIDSEIVRVDAIDATTNTLTIARGYDGSTAATHTSGASVYLIANYNPKLDGSHFAGGADVGGLASPWFSSSALAGINLAGSARSGFQANTTTTVTTNSFAGVIDPAVFAPGDFEDDRVLVEVWARFAHDANMASLRIAAYTSDDVSASPATFDLENGSTGLAHATNASVVFRFARIGLVSVPYSDIANRKRVQLTVQASWAATGFAFYMDYVMLTRPGRRVMLPTGIDYAAATSAGMFGAASQNLTRRTYSDLSGEVWRHDAAYANEYHQKGSGYPVGGMLGNPIVLPTPNADAIVKLNHVVPNAPTAPTTADVFSTTSVVGVSVNVTPRFRTIRS